MALRAKHRKSISKSAASAIAAATLFAAIGFPALIASTVSEATQASISFGAAEHYAVLAGLGITNTGPTNASGSFGADYGSSPTVAFTGNSVVTMTGTKYLSLDAATSGAKSDLQIAYDEAVGRTQAVPITSGLGNLTLTEGVYNSPSKIGLTGPARPARNGQICHCSHQGNYGSQENQVSLGVSLGRATWPLLNSHYAQNLLDGFRGGLPALHNQARAQGPTAELNQVIHWLTGYTDAELKQQIAAGATFREFFDGAELNPLANLITGVICGVKVQEIEDPLMQKIRYLDKLVDELAKGKAMEKVLRQPTSMPPVSKI